MLRKITSIIVLFVLIANVAVPASAAEAIVSDNQSFSVMELERFLSLTKEGTIYFDVAGAKAAGYPAANINAIYEHITMMNTLATEFGQKIDENFTLTLHFSNTRAGISDVVIYPHGLTEVYFNSSQAQAFITGIENSQGFANGVAKGVEVYAELCSSNLLEEAFLNAVAHVITKIPVIYKWQVTMAASSGTGIIMSVLDDGTTAVPLVSFSPQ